MHRFHAPLFLAAVFAVSLPARAEFFNNSSGFVDPAQTITFDEVSLTPNEPVTTQFQTYGVTFENAYGNPDPGDYPNITGNRIGNFQSGVPSRTLLMNFDSVVGGVAFSMITAPGEGTFTALLNGAVVESATASTSPTDVINFYGFRNIAFDEVTVNVASGNNGALLLDNLQTAPVPEPGTWVLMLAGAALVGTLTARRKM